MDNGSIRIGDPVRVRNTDRTGVVVSFIGNGEDRVMLNVGDCNPCYNVCDLVPEPLPTEEERTTVHRVVKLCNDHFHSHVAPGFHIDRASDEYKAGQWEALAAVTSTVVEALIGEPPNDKESQPVVHAVEEEE